MYAEMLLRKTGPSKNLYAVGNDVIRFKCILQCFNIIM